MRKLTESERQTLDSLQSDEAILLAIEELTGSKFVRDGRLDEESAAYDEWVNGYNAGEVVALAWSMVDENHDRLVWGASSFTK